MNVPKEAFGGQITNLAVLTIINVHEFKSQFRAADIHNWSTELLKLFRKSLY